jgi:hypothetical protein
VKGIPWLVPAFQLRECGAEVTVDLAAFALVEAMQSASRCLPASQKRLFPQSSQWTATGRKTDFLYGLYF